MTQEEKLEYLEKHIHRFNPNNCKDIEVDTFEWRCCPEKNENGKLVFNIARLEKFGDEGKPALGKIGQCPKCEKWFYFFYDNVKNR